MQPNQRRYFIECMIHALFWVGVYYVLKALTVSSFSMVVNHNGTRTEAISATVLFPFPGIVLGSLMLLFYGAIFWLFKRMIRYKSNFRRVAVMTGWLMLLFATNYLVIRGLIASLERIHPIHIPMPPPSVPPPLGHPTHFGMDSLTDGMGSPLLGLQSQAGNWEHLQLVMALLFLAVMGIAVAYFFIKEWIRNDLKRSEVEAHQLKTEVKFLRSQVNPHFLFNTLNNLFSMAQKRGNEDLADGLSKLSGMMRYMIYESNTENVSLQKEIEYLKDCVALSKLRFADSEVSVTFCHPDQALIADVQIAPMLFIPFLENAFKHGVLIGRHSCIAMTISVNQKKLLFTCENTDYSRVKKLEEEKGGIGLENVKRRLELLYPSRYELRARTEDGKYRVNLQIDLA